MKKLLFIGLFLTGIGVITFSCKKKEGCVDSDASNYDTDAKVDDGSCKYKTSATIYLGEATGKALSDSGIVYTVDIYIDGEYEWSISPSAYMTSPPACEDQAGVVYASFSRPEQNPTVNIQMIDINNKVWYDEDVKMTSDCNLVEI